MKRPLTWFQLVAALHLGALLLTGCSAQTRHKILCVFFTGVDDPQPVTISPMLATMGNSNTFVRAAALPPEPVIHFHKPYSQRKCDSCHVPGQSQGLVAKGGDLCLKCHDDLIVKPKVIHSPVEDGDCLRCHHPHESTEPFLLTRRGQEVCIDCHKMRKMVAIAGHANMGGTLCVSCHDPHCSQKEYLLKAAK